MTAAPALLAQELGVQLGRTQILDGLTMTVQRGDLYGLLGRNGAGKTTAMRCLLGYLPRFRGRCEVFGVAAGHIHRVTTPIGVALDPPGLDDTLSVRQNLELARIRAGIRSGRSVDDVLELVGLSHRQHNRGDRLSHGQGRRAAVARALLGEPELLVLDEPLSGLDPEGVEELLELFHRITRVEQVTILLSSHHLREVQDVCNRVGLIEAGRVVLEGETEALLAAAGAALCVRCHHPEKARPVLQQAAYLSELREDESGALRAKLATGHDPAPLIEELVAAGAGLQEFRSDHATLVEVFREALR